MPRESDYPIDCYGRYQYDQKHYDENDCRIPQGDGSDDAILHGNDNLIRLGSYFESLDGVSFCLD